MVWSRFQHWGYFSPSIGAHGIYFTEFKWFIGVPTSSRPQYFLVIDISKWNTSSTLSHGRHDAYIQLIIKLKNGINALRCMVFAPTEKPITLNTHNTGAGWTFKQAVFLSRNANHFFDKSLFNEVKFSDDVGVCFDIDYVRTCAVGCDTAFISKLLLFFFLFIVQKMNVLW